MKRIWHHDCSILCISKTKSEKKYLWNYLMGYPCQMGGKKIRVIIENLTKYIHFMRIGSSDSTKRFTEIYCKNIYKLRGFQKIIVREWDAKFKGNFWKEFFKQLGTSLNMSSTYLPKQMGKLKFSINVWKHTFVVL